MLQRVIKVCGLVFVGCCIGVISQVIYEDRVKASFWEFTFIDLVRLITYSLIGIYVAYYLKNRFSDRQMKKNLFVDITNDIAGLFEEELPHFNSFMKSRSKNDAQKIKVTLALKKISNKISVLERNRAGFGKDISKLVDEVRCAYDEIKGTITGDEFTGPRSFSQQNISNVLRLTCNIIFKLDEMKLGIFD